MSHSHFHKFALLAAFCALPVVAFAEQQEFMVPGIEYDGIGPDGVPFVAIFAKDGTLMRRPTDERVKSTQADWQRVNEELCIKFEPPGPRISCAPEREFGDGGFRYFDGDKVYEFTIRERRLTTETGGMVPGTTYRADTPGGAFELVFDEDGGAQMTPEGREPLDYVDIWYRNGDQLCLEDDEMIETQCMTEGPALGDGRFVITVQGNEVEMSPI